MNSSRYWSHSCNNVYHLGQNSEDELKKRTHTNRPTSAFPFFVVLFLLFLEELFVDVGVQLGACGVLYRFVRCAGGEGGGGPCG